MMQRHFLHILTNLCRARHASTGFPIVGGGEGHPPPILQFFPKPRPIKTDPPWATLSLKNEAPHLKTNPPLESEALFQEMILRKKSRKIGNCH